MKQHEKDERQALLAIVGQMNELHSKMGGRDGRSERKALLKCMNILTKEIQNKTQEYLQNGSC